MLYTFADCELDTHLYTLRRSGNRLQLRPKVFHVLLYLVENRHRVVPKQELLEHVWPEHFISDATLENCIKDVRQVIGDSGRDQRLIHTLRGYGYRFAAAIASRAETHRDSATESTELLAPLPAPDAAQMLLTPEISAGERKVVTILCCALDAAPSLQGDFGLDARHSLMRTLHTVVQGEVRRYGGTVQHVLSEHIVAVFGAPMAQEDHATRAVLAALSIQQRAAEQREGVMTWPERGLAVRMGLHTGPVAVGGIADEAGGALTMIGNVARLAVILQERAAPGTLLCSAATARLVRDTVHLEVAEPVPVVGQTPPVATYKVLRHSPQRLVWGDGRVLSRFVGRTRELAILQGLLAQVKAGHGQVVGIVGEPGMGKSRLLYEFRQHLNGTSVTYVEGHCLSYGQATPYLPVLDALRHLCGLTDADAVETLVVKVHDALQAAGLVAAAGAPYLLQLLGVQAGADVLAMEPPAARKPRTFEVLHQLTLSRSQQQPLVMAIENLHWIDPTSEEYLAALVDQLVGAPLLLLLTYRPGYRPPWIDKSYATQFTLPPLTPLDSLTVVQSVLQTQSLPDVLVQRVLAKAAGNPFFLEELTRAVLEHDARTILQTVPDTIQAVLTARIDRLPAEEKRLLQTAAVLGREFLPRLLAAIWEGTDPLEPLLLGLKQREFLYERPGAEEPMVMFKHALTQEVAYGSLLTARRQALHAAAGHALAMLSQERLAERSEELAHHFTVGEVWDKAFAYLARSGDKARQAYANQEAIAFYTHALEVSQRVTPAVEAKQLLPVYEGRGRVWFLLTKYDEAITDFQGMRQMARASGQPHQEGESLCHLAITHLFKQSEDHLLLAEQYAQEAQQLGQPLGDAKILARSLASLGSVEVARGNMAEADRQLVAALQLSRQEGDKEALAPTLRTLSAQAYFQGKFQSAIHFAQEGVSVARDIHDGFHELRCLASLSLAQWSRGDYQQAFSVTYEALTKAHERQNMHVLSRMKNHLGWFYRELGAVSRAAELDYESTDLGHTHGIANVEISALINLGLDYLALGQPARAASYLAPTLDRVVREAFGQHRWRWQIRLLIGLAELSYTTGTYDQALHYVEEGIKAAQATTSRKYMALGWAWRGKIASKLGDAETAGAELQRALALAEPLHSPSLIYPIAYDLGQWYENTGKERQAAALYGKAKAIIERMATAVEDDSLRAPFLQSMLVQTITACVARLGR